MGSSPSTPKSPGGHSNISSPRGSTGKTPHSARGFQEVEFKTVDNNRHSNEGGASNSNHRRESSNNYSSHSHSNGHGYGQDISHLNTQTQQRQSTTLSEFEQPTYTEGEDMVLETFHHKNGQSYNCVYQGGQRFYMDSWQTQDWQPFPQQWFKEGILITDKVMKNEEQGTVSNGGEQTSEMDTRGPVTSRDDREGFIDHPKKGRLSTYMFEEKRNVNYYFDKDNGYWVPLPIVWELRSVIIKELLPLIEEALPNWTDRQDMLAALRASNYDPHDCISTYLITHDETSEIPASRNSKDTKLLEETEKKNNDLSNQAKKLKQELDSMKRSLDREKSEKKASEELVCQLQEQVSSLEVELSTSKAQFEAHIRETPKETVSNAKKFDPEISGKLVALNASCMFLHKQLVQLKMEVRNKSEEMRIIFKPLAEGVHKISRWNCDQDTELDHMRSLYRQEALQRKLLYNKLQELRGNIRVFCRCRNDNEVDCYLKFPSDREIMIPDSKKVFKFDKVFAPSSQQEEIYEDTKPIITSCVDGYNVCILAYGQTGSGKTFTMNGIPSKPGVNVRSIKDLLQICNEREHIRYDLKASMVEIYNETIVDLLSNDGKVLEIRQQGKKINLPGIIEMAVNCEDDIDEILQLGDKNRSVASTKMNSQSSRSHLIFIITVEGQNSASGATSVGTLTLCDLAGSERVGKTEAQGQRLVEASAINKSLSSLGQVFTSLKTAQLHVPYRNSKLTQILQPSLGGDAKACLFVTVSPDIRNASESLSTLQFGSNARQVQLGPARQNIKKM